MPVPIVPIALGAIALYALLRPKSAYAQAPADGSSPPVKEKAPAAKGWQEMPPALQEQVASALGALGVSPATGELSGAAVSAEALQMATQTAGLCESQGFYEVAKELRRYIAQAAPKVATPPSAAPIKAAAPPGLSPAQIEAIARTLTLDRDPQVIRALLETLRKLPPSPQRDNYVQMTEALLLQLAAAQSTTQTMQQIDQVIRSPGIAEVHAATAPLPPVVVPTPTPAPAPMPTPKELPPTLPPAPVPQLVTLPAPSVVTAPSPTPKPAPTPSKLNFATIPDPAPKAVTLYQGMPNAKTASVILQVKSWQTILKKFGHDLGKFGPAKDGIDGDFGATTKAATIAFQSYGKLNVDPSIVTDGKVGPVTRRLVAYRAALATTMVSGYQRMRRSA